LKTIFIKNLAATTGRLSFFQLNVFFEATHLLFLLTADKGSVVAGRGGKRWVLSLKQTPVSVSIPQILFARGGGDRGGRSREEGVERKGGKED
jgi:hypothetical protein